MNHSKPPLRNPSIDPVQSLMLPVPGLISEYVLRNAPHLKQRENFIRCLTAALSKPIGESVTFSRIGPIDMSIGYCPQKENTLIVTLHGLDTTAAAECIESYNGLFSTAALNRRVLEQAITQIDPTIMDVVIGEVIREKYRIIVTIHFQLKK